MMFIERLRELVSGLLPGNRKHNNSAGNLTNCDHDGVSPRGNPWTRDLERFQCYTREDVDKRTVTSEMKIQLLMEQARLEKAKEALKQQQQQQRITIGDAPTQSKPKRRTQDATITDAAAWWGQSVATWDPDDAKNLGPQGELKHPRQHKWFNQ